MRLTAALTAIGDLPPVVVAGLRKKMVALARELNPDDPYLAIEVAEALGDAGLEPEIIVAPAMGGLIIGHETARALDLAVADHAQGRFVAGQLQDAALDLISHNKLLK